MLDTAVDQAFSLIITAEGKLEIELGTSFTDDCVERLVSAATAVTEAIST